MTNQELEALGLTPEQVSGVFKINGLDIENARAGVTATEAELKIAKDQLQAASTEIAGFKDMDIDGIKQAADDYKEKFEAAEAQRKTEIDNLKFEAELDKQILKAQGRNPATVKAVLQDIATLQAAEDRESAIKAALDKAQESDPYLFNIQAAEPDKPKGTGGAIGAGEKKKTTPPEENYGAAISKSQGKADKTGNLDAYKL